MDSRFSFVCIRATRTFIHFLRSPCQEQGDCCRVQRKIQLTPEFFRTKRVRER
jgi:hypothetical protein